MNRSRKYTVILLIVLLVAVFSLPVTARSGSGDASWRKTVQSYIRIPCLSCEQVAYGKQVIRGLDYNSQRIFRKMSLLPGASFSLSRKAWDSLFRLHLTYEQMLAFEEWADLSGATMELSLSALPEIKSLNYQAGKSFRSYLGLEGIKATFALQIIPLIATLEDANNQAVQAFFAVGDMDAHEALNSLVTLGGLTIKQAWTCEAFARIKDMNRETILDSLPLIRQLREDDAWNAHTLYKQEDMDRLTAWNWLVSYFATPPPVQEAQFYRQSAEKRKSLLRAFYDGGEELIWKINNLHAVTDRFGFEVSDAQMERMSGKALYSRFLLLSQKTQFAYGKRFYPAYHAGRHSTMVSLLRQATSADRKQVSRDLTSANIYALLAQGSELYDSSFRDILVPILKKRISENHQDNLLSFLKAIDPDNLLVSNFIVSLAQKGKLTTFFPENDAEQEQILQLVAASAFKDEDTILLFSATFKHLLTVLETGARSFLIHRMVMEADRGSATFSRLINVILQYYLQEYPELLGTRDRVLITRAIIRHGAVDLSRFLVTPFEQWKADSRLGSISVFHPDDDGRQSFVSNGRTLLKNGYRLTLSRQYTLSFLSPPHLQQFNALIASGSQSGKGLPRLFAEMQRKGFAVAFEKQINGITILHATSVYAGEKEQQELLKRFLQGGDEMFAQRGHSYWRSEQITDPLEILRREKKISAQDLQAKQRFMSLGSCGGVKAYTRLTRMFLGHIDILATIGTGMAIINDPYNTNFFEVVAQNPSTITWKDMADKSAFIFAGGRGRDYLQPGSLTAILHKILDEQTAENEEPETPTGESARHRQPEPETS